jgi:Protein of unknown function (DUF2924)
MTMTQQISALQQLSVQQLRTKFAELFGESTNAHNRDWLLRRIAWRLQAMTKGDLSERAKRRAAELANDADLRVVPPRERRLAETKAPKASAILPDTDERLPSHGATITRLYKGKTLQVKVVNDSFEFEGRTYRSLSAVAKAITGSHCNGYLFFRLPKKGTSK